MLPLHGGMGSRRGIPTDCPSILTEEGSRRASPRCSSPGARWGAGGHTASAQAGGDLQMAWAVGPFPGQSDVPDCHDDRHRPARMGWSSSFRNGHFRTIFDAPFRRRPNFPKRRSIGSRALSTTRSASRPTNLAGCFQSERYFEHCAEEVRGYFAPEEEKVASTKSRVSE